MKVGVRQNLAPFSESWKGMDHMTQMRMRIRRAARVNNGFGFFCSCLVCLFRKGPKATVRLIDRRVGPGIALKQYVHALKLTKQERENQASHVFDENVLLSVVVPLYNTPLDLLKETLASVQNQTYSGWELCLADGSDTAHSEVERFCMTAARSDGRIRYRKLEKNGGISDNTNACLDMARGAYIVLFDHDDLLLPDALFEVMKVICRDHADFIYSDEMIFRSPDPGKIIGTHFKPDYAPFTLLSNNYICHLTVFRRELLSRTGLFRKAYDGSQDHDMILRLTHVAEKIVHIPRVLYLWRAVANSVALDISTKTYAIEAGKKAVRDFVADAYGLQVTVESTPAYPTLYRIRFPIAGTPRILVIVVSSLAPEEERKALACLRESTEWNRVRYIIAHVRSDIGKRAAIQRAMQDATEEYIVFLDGFLRPQHADWLVQLLMLAQHRQIGAVGGKVLFDDGTLRHAGVVLGLGGRRAAGRIYFQLESSYQGYFGQLAVVTDVSAVTAECMMVAREKLQEVQGLSDHYENALFDVDLCLRLREKGYENLLCPYAEMMGGQPEGFGLNVGQETATYDADAKAFLTAWQNVVEDGDPFYHPELSLDMEDMRLRKR